MKYLVLGSGLMGRAVAYDLLRHEDTKALVLADISPQNLQETQAFLDDSRVFLVECNLEARDQVKKIMADVDVAVAAVHYKLNEHFSQVAIDTHTHLCDLGGNSQVVDRQLLLDERADEAGVSIVPDCGLAPGMVAVLVAWGLEKYSWVESVQIRVGGLPKKPWGVLRYGRLFAVEGLMNEYVEPVRVLREGRSLTLEPLTEIEDLEFPAPFNTMEAFTTSGGTSTLIDTYRHRVKNLDYKTIRYPGHGMAIRAMYELGLFSNEHLRIAGAEIAPRTLMEALFERKIPPAEQDVTLVRIVFRSGSKKRELTIIDHATEQPRLTSMMRMTAFPAAIVAHMQATGVIAKRGVLPQERCVPTQAFLSELAKRNIVIDGIDS